MTETKNYSLDEIKSTLQEIINKHLDEGESFDVQRLDEEGIFLLLDILTTKDKESRDLIWQSIHEKVVQAEQEYSQAHERIQAIYEQIMNVSAQLKVSEQLGSALEEIKSSLKNNESLSQLEKELWM